MNKLIIFTGKGGVGKSVLSHALAHKLHSDGSSVELVSFDQAPLDLPQTLYKTTKIDIVNSLKTYIALKLNSKTIAKWIAESKFFKALFQIVPSFANLLVIGDILYRLDQKENHITIFDAPSSGHFITLVESLAMFKKIFKVGILVDDIDKIRSRLEDSSYTTTNIVSIPTELSYQEAIELKESLLERNVKGNIILNNCLSPLANKLMDELPAFLKIKVQSENDIINKSKDCPIIRASLEDSISRKIVEIAPQIGDAV